MDFLDYASGGEDDDCNVDDIEYDQEREDYIESSEQLNAVSDLEFIASNAADCTFDFNGQTSPELNIALPPPDLENDESSSDGDSEDDEGSVKMVAEKVVESSSSSDSSDSEEEVITKKQYNKQSKQIHWLTEEEGEDMATGPLKTKNEIDEVVEPLDHSHIEIRDTADLTCIGEVMYRIDHECVVVIQADYTTSPLNEGSIICNIDGKVLGKVQEIFGPITTPFYTVRWKNAVAAGAGSNNKGGKGGAQNKKQNNKNNSKQKGKKGAMVVETAATAEEPEVIAAQPAAVAEGSMDTEIELDSSLAVSPTAPAVADIAPAEKTASATTPEATAAVEEATAVSEPAKVVSGLEISDVRALFPVGARLFTVTSHCSFVLPAQLQKAYAKGSDASNAYDEEPPEEELEYSDDEQEMLAKQARKQSKKGAAAGTTPTTSTGTNDASFGDAIPTGYEKGGFGRGRGKKVPNFGATGARNAGIPTASVPQPQVFGQYANAVPMQGQFPAAGQHMQMPMQGYMPMPGQFGMPMQPQQPMYGMPGQHFQNQPFQPYAQHQHQPPIPSAPAPVPYMSGAYNSNPYNGGAQYGMPQMQSPHHPSGYAPSLYAQPPMPSSNYAATHGVVSGGPAPPPQPQQGQQQLPQYQYMPIQYGAPGAAPTGSYPPNRQAGAGHK